MRCVNLQGTVLFIVFTVLFMLQNTKSLNKQLPHLQQ